MRTIMSLADQANRYLDKEKPWIIAKDVTKKEQVQEICTMGLNLFRILMIYLKPVVPTIARQAEAFLDIDNQHWSDINQLLINHQINSYEPLLTRLQKENIDAMINASK
jgi:methionyl-tRNA synthetase